MAVNNYNLLTAGTTLRWAPSGGDYAFTLTSLANGSARQGAKGDLGEFWKRRWRVRLQTALGAAGTNGNLVEVWWSPSTSATAGTDNVGNASGTDAAYATPGEYKFQLRLIGMLYVSNNAGTGVQAQDFEFFPPTRYGSPVVVNSSGLALSGTASNHELSFAPIDEPNTTTSTG